MFSLYCYFHEYIFIYTYIYIHTYTYIHMYMHTYFIYIISLVMSPLSLKKAIIIYSLVISTWYDWTGYIMLYIPDVILYHSYSELGVTWVIWDSLCNLSGFHTNHPTSRYIYPPVSSTMACWKISELNGGLFRNIIGFSGPFSSTPCWITRGYIH